MNRSADQGEFLVLSTGGLFLAFTLDGSTRATLAAGVPRSESAITASLRVGSDDAITISLGCPESGPETRREITQMVAEELMVDSSRIHVQFSPQMPDAPPGGPTQRGHFARLRRAAATSREMLLRAASLQFGVPTQDCVAAGGMIINTRTNQALAYGSLAGFAAALPAPANPAQPAEQRAAHHLWPISTSGTAYPALPYGLLSGSHS
jgi:isoquinoline 1-oxidoreductase subunit beta